MPRGRALRICVDQLIPVFILALVFAPNVFACEGDTVRDAGFREPRAVHRLCVIAHADDAAARQTCERLDRWLAGAGRGMNLELLRVNADDPNVDWDEYGIPTAPPSMPAVALIGHGSVGRRNFVIDHWEPAPSAEDLAALARSPARQALQRELGRRLAVLVHVPGTGSHQGAAEKVLDRVVETWSMKVPLGLGRVRVDRSDARERLLLAFTGAPRTERDWVAVVFGRGKFMPGLAGEEITEANLDECLNALTQPCTCMRSPSVLGVDVPMRWDDRLDAAVVSFGAAGGVGSASPSKPGVGSASLSASVEPVLSTMLWTLGALTVAVIGTAVVMIRRSHREGSA